MKVSNITVNGLKEYLRLDEDEDLQPLLDAAKSYVKSYTGMTDKEMDEKEEIVPSIYVLVADMHDNRSYSAGRKYNNSNAVIESILNMHSKNLL